MALYDETRHQIPVVCEACGETIETRMSVEDEPNILVHPSACPTCSFEEG